MDWTKLRDEMPITRRWAFFDHAAVAPLSGRAQKALAEWAADLADNGLVNERQWTERVEKVRGWAARLINSEPQEIAFVKNTSEGIGIVAEGLDWHTGDNIVTAAEEYPANIYPWMNLASRGVETRLVASRDGRLWLDDIAQAIDSRTRLVSLSFVEFASGFRNDLDAVGSLCRERGILFFVDAIQGLGILPLDVRRMPIDFLAADGHKWLLGPEGAGIFYIRNELVERLRPVGIGWNSVVGARNFSKIDFRLKPHAGRWESGSLNVAGITALGASLEWLLEIGPELITNRVLELADYVCELAEKAGFTVYSSRRQEDKSAIVSLTVPVTDIWKLVRHCRAEGIVINQRAGRVRISAHAYNNHEEIDQLFESLKSGTHRPE